MEAILGAILGGVLTIVGGLMVALVADRSERRKMFLSNIEAIHQVATEVLAWSEAGIQQVIVAPAGQWDVERMKVRPPTEQLSLLVDIYEPDLAPVVRSLLTSVDEQRSASFDFYHALTTAQGEQATEAQRDSAAQAMDEAFDRVSIHHDTLRDHYDDLERRLVADARHRAGK